MNDDLVWNIGREAVGDECLEVAPCRAYFWQLRDGCLVGSFDLSRRELETEVLDRPEEDGCGDAFRQALDALKRVA